jgi:hypothetical protein
MAACGIWIIFYCLMGGGVISPPTDEDSARHLVLNAVVFNVNSVAVLLAGIALSRREKIQTPVVLLAFLATPVVTILGNWIAEDVCELLHSGNDSGEALLIPSSYMAGLVLIYCFYAVNRHLTSERQRPATTRGMQGLAIWAFGGYALLQREYVSLFDTPMDNDAETFIYICAMILKIVCTVMLFFLPTITVTSDLKRS